MKQAADVYFATPSLASSKTLIETIEQSKLPTQDHAPCKNYHSIFDEIVTHVEKIGSTPSVQKPGIHLVEVLDEFSTISDAGFSDTIKTELGNTSKYDPKAFLEWIHFKKKDESCLHVDNNPDGDNDVDPASVFVKKATTEYDKRSKALSEIKDPTLKKTREMCLKALRLAKKKLTKHLKHKAQR